MNSRGITVLAVVLGLGMAQSLAAEDWIVPQGQWYFSPLMGVNFEDKARHSNPGITGSLGFGRQVSQNWAVEVSLFGGRNRGFNEFRPVGGGVDLLYNIGSAGLITPYLIVGSGYVRGDVIEGPSIAGELNYDAAIGTAGIGLVAPLGDASTRLRTEVRYRTEFHGRKFSDVLAMIGLYVPIGETPADRPARPAKTTKGDGDQDGDGVANEIDVCPNTFSNSVVDEFGCEKDSDGDGVGNMYDDCPGTRLNSPVNSRGCSNETDTDQDGVADKDDRCPGTPRTASVTANGCESDDDGDGVINSLDNCPNSVAGARINIRGCEIGATIKLPGVRFELSSATLMSTTTSKLDQVAATLRANTDLMVEAAGYTDTSGSATLNLNLSQKRAESVRRYLISKGVNASSITARGYGEANPVANNSTRYGRMENRRVELRILN